MVASIVEREYEEPLADWWTPDRIAIVRRSREAWEARKRADVRLRIGDMLLLPTNMNSSIALMRHPNGHRLVRLFCTCGAASNFRLSDIRRRGARHCRCRGVGAGTRTVRYGNPREEAANCGANLVANQIVPVYPNCDQNALWVAARIAVIDAIYPKIFAAAVGHEDCDAICRPLKR